MALFDFNVTTCKTTQKWQKEGHFTTPVLVDPKLFDIMNKADRHSYQILTKRSERMLELNSEIPWAKHIWMGVTVEDAGYKFRIDDLRKTKANVKFLSFEPLIGNIGKVNLKGIDWVIVGGESGPGARPMKEEWRESRVCPLDYWFTGLDAGVGQTCGTFFPNAKIECARFKGTDTQVFLDQATIDGPIHAGIEPCIAFVKKNIRLASKIGEVYRKDKWEYPLKAIREAVGNAVIHRDYSILGSDIKLAIFDDMIEITSPGPLPDTISVQQFPLQKDLTYLNHCKFPKIVYDENFNELILQQKIYLRKTNNINMLNICFVNLFRQNTVIPTG